MNHQNNKKEIIYYVKGMHCTSCEILIEQKFLDLEKIKAVEASLGKGKVIVEYEGQKPELNKINGIFRSDSYIFSEIPFVEKSNFDFNTL